MSSGYDGLAPCVHCGFCLPACPTYAVTGDEADGPRGRIVLMQGIATGTLAPDDPDAASHLDRCLGCRACEPACPSGVRYGEGLEAARTAIATARGTPLLARLVLTIMAVPSLRSLVFGLARLVRPLAALLARHAFPAGMLAGTTPSFRRPRASPLPHLRPSTLFLGCIQRELFAHVHDATRATLAANGWSCEEPGGQGCCGALHAHAGHHDEAVALARANVRAFAATAGPIAVNSAGCGAMLKSYGALLPDDPDAAALAARVQDVTELLAANGPAPGRPLALRVAYDAPCHLQHAQGVVDPPLAVLRAIPGLTVVPHAGADRCCGSAGIYSLVESAMSRAVLDAKLDALQHAEIDVIATGNPGCQMQIAAGLARRGVSLPVCHPVELLAASYRASGLHSRV